MVNGRNCPKYWFFDLAVTRKNNVLRLFINGVKVAEQVVTVDLNYLGKSLTVGGAGYALKSIKGYLNSVRVTKGVCRYEENYIPVAPF